jgi:hypothetical protein
MAESENPQPPIPSVEPKNPDENVHKDLLMQLLKSHWFGVLVAIFFGGKFTWGKLFALVILCACSLGAVVPFIVSHYNGKISDIKQADEQKFSDLQDKASDISGQLTETRQERDTAQIRLAPFEGLAVSIYTNAPIGESLQKLFVAFSDITNELTVLKPKKSEFSVTLNDNPLIRVDTKPSAMVVETNLVLSVTNSIKFIAIETAETTAVHPSFDFFCASDPTNIFLDSGWYVESKTDDLYHWHSTSTDSVPRYSGITPSLIKFGTNLIGKSVDIVFDIYSENSDEFQFDARLHFTK